MSWRSKWTVKYVVEEDKLGTPLSLSRTSVRKELVYSDREEVLAELGLNLLNQKLI